MSSEEIRLLRKKRKALNDGNKNAIASFCEELAVLYSQKRNYKESIAEYKEAANIYKQIGKMVDYGIAHRMIGESYCSMLCFENALKHQTIHLNIAKQENDKLEQQRALATIGDTYLRRFLEIENPDRENLVLAQKSFMKSLMICESLTGIEVTEHKDMLARLFANLGVVQECLGNIEKSLSLVEKSINICKKYELYEQLERNYSFLGTLHVRQENYNKAILHFNLAIEVAGRLENKVALICNSLLAKADVLIKLYDFANAKNILLKAYKMKTPIEEVHENIVHCLKVVAALYYTEETLIVTGDNDYKTRKSLYETMGDGASDLKLFAKAIEYYKKMLREAELNGEKGKDLCPAYVSLAESFKDNKQYDLAIEYFQKEYSVYDEKDKDTQNTLFNIAECMNLAGKSPNEIEKIYNKAHVDAISSGNSYLKGRVLNRLIAFYRKNSMDSKADSFESELRSTEYHSSETESDSSDIQVTTNVGDDICIENITDNEEDSDGEDLNKPRSVRRRTKGFAVKKNNKGETQLHLACISGNLTLARKLIEQGHPVNVRDHAGWLPLHEACNLGHQELVELLLDKGAAINDRGGTSCFGLTPLHDAASNGHLRIVELLLDGGASPICKTDDGDTPLHSLKQWRNQAGSLDASTKNFYETLVSRLTNSLEKAGHTGKVTVNQRKKSSALVNEDESIFDKANRSEAATSSKLSLMRKSSNGSLSNLYNLDTDSDSGSEGNAASDYKSVMKNIRKRIPEKQSKFSPKESESKKPSLLRPDEVGDDWLEDDLGPTRPQKKRKTLAEAFVNNVQKRNLSTSFDKQNKGAKALTIERKSSSRNLEDFSEKNQNNQKRNSFERKGSKDSDKKQSFSEEISVPDGFFDVDFKESDNGANENVYNVESDNSASSLDSVTFADEANKKRKRKQQISLIQAGFTRLLTDKIPNHNQSSNNGEKAVRKQQKQLTNFGLSRASTSPIIIQDTSNSDVFNATFSSSVTIPAQLQMFSADVRVEGVLYRVPIPGANFQHLTIKWLKEETARRYFKREFIEPSLELRTSNGAVLDEDDLLSMLFLPGTTKSEEIIAKIVKWNLPSLQSRYHEACVNSEQEQNEDVIAAITRGGEIAINLSHKILRFENLNPLFKSLRHQLSLQELNLTFTYMTDDAFQCLSLVFPTLNNLKTLNISENYLTEKSLRYFAESLDNSKTVLPNLTELNISSNAFGNGAYKHLAIISKYLNLTSLIMKMCDFNENIFNEFGNNNLELNLENTHHFDISHNDLNQHSIMKFVSFINREKITYLNVANNCNVTCSGLVSEISSFFDNCDKLSLQTLILERCHANDEELIELLRVLQKAFDLKTLNLRYNQNLTSISLLHLMEHSPSLREIYIEYVDILKGFESCSSSQWKLANNSEDHCLRCLIMDSSSHEQATEYLKNLWMNRYPEKGTVNFKLHTIELSVND